MTTRINEAKNPTTETQSMLDQVKAKLGMVPNLFKVFANSPAVLEFYLNASGALAKSKINAALREQIALTVAGANGCDYCASAHTAIGKMHKVDEAELALNLKTESNDPKTKAALIFSRKIVDARGNVQDADIAQLRAAGYDDQELSEIIAVVSFNIFTNYFNHIANTKIDFPLVSTSAVKKAA